MSAKPEQTRRAKYCSHRVVRDHRRARRFSEDADEPGAWDAAVHDGQAQGRRRSDAGDEAAEAVLAQLVPVPSALFPSVPTYAAALWRSRP
jgi:hypothetical protein